MTATRPLVLITGIAEGLGTSVPQVFAAAGHDVLGLSRSAAATQQIGRLIGHSPILLRIDYIHRRGLCFPLSSPSGSSTSQL